MTNKLDHFDGPFGGRFFGLKHISHKKSHDQKWDILWFNFVGKML